MELQQLNPGTNAIIRLRVSDCVPEAAVSLLDSLCRVPLPLAMWVNRSSQAHTPICGNAEPSGNTKFKNDITSEISISIAAIGKRDANISKTLSRKQEQWTDEDAFSSGLQTYLNEEWTEGEGEQ